MGDSISFLNRAILSIIKHLGRVIRKSHVYCSESWGYKSPKVFYNQCLMVETELSPYEILEKIIAIEKEMGRVRTGAGYSDREIDIDILFFGKEIVTSKNLSIPHPRMHLRKFVLVPMNEIAGDHIHPVFKKSISELLAECGDESMVTLEI